MSSIASCGVRSKQSRWRSVRVQQSQGPSIEDTDNCVPTGAPILVTPNESSSNDDNGKVDIGFDEVVTTSATLLVAPTHLNVSPSHADKRNVDVGLDQVTVDPSELLVALVKQNRHLVVNLRHEAYDIYVGRDWAGKPADAGDCHWGNPFSKFQEPDLKARTSLYMNWLFENPVMIARARTELSGKTLGCGCVPKYCHGWVLAAVANCSDQEAELLCAACTGESHAPFKAAIEHLCADKSTKGYGKGKGKNKGGGKGHDKGGGKRKGYF
mmetsp:Transcript_157226/g.293327  ORF Transcript_157226/g.293327 Transcript_157226/m.293327 type:complete len:269 (+) Transcript_157226:45-851(+)